MFDLERWRGKTAVVTGASSGIGSAVAEALAKAGMQVAIMARRKERLDSLAQRIEADGGKVMVFAGDVGSQSDVQTLLARIQSEWNGLDVLVNNAGTGMMSTLAEGLTDDWRSTMDINVTAPAMFIREALPQLEARDEAQIVNVTSIYGHRNQVPNFSFYQASKFAFRALTDTLRAELAAKGTKIRIGMISPGMVATEFRERATHGAFPYESYFADYEPLSPADISDAVVYMLSTAPHVQIQDILLSPMGQGL